MSPDCNPLNALPALRSPDDILAWLEDAVAQSKALAIDPHAESAVLAFTVNDATYRKWRLDKDTDNKFILAVLLADWSCYASQENREEYLHLKNMFEVFPQGFRLVMTKSGENYIPAGYTAFYPISQDDYSRLKNSPESITDRKQITPIPASTSENNYIYIHNISIIKQLYKTHASRIMVKKFFTDVASLNARALAAIVVSPDGQRVIEKFGLRHSGFITHAGHKEMAYVSEQTASSRNTPLIPPS
jgi:hypothetical protein